MQSSKNPNGGSYSNAKRVAEYDRTNGGLYIVKLFNINAMGKVETLFGYTKDVNIADKACKEWVERSTFPKWLKSRP
jgi:hypothetical protein